MKADYRLGVCFSNNDPLNLGRIRAIPIDILGKFVGLPDIISYIDKEDINANETLLYRPWYVVKTQQFKERDKYLCEPFLPKNIGVIPNPGQLVKIITYDDLDNRAEFIGPYTIDQVTLNEEYRNVVNNLQKNINLTEVIPKRGKTFISGYSGEQLMLGDNEFLIRLGHINPGNKTRKSSYPFIQLSQFNSSYNIKEKTNTSTETPDYPIDYICQLYLNYSPKNNSQDKNFTANLILFDATSILNTNDGIGLSKKNYDNNSEYIDETTSNYIVKHYINTSNINQLIKIIDEIISGYNNGGVVKYFNPSLTQTQQRFETNTTTIITYNNVGDSPNKGGALSEINIVPGIKNWIFRLKPNTRIINYSGSLMAPSTQTGIEYIRFTEFQDLDRFIMRYGTERKFGNLLLNRGRTVTTVNKIPEATNKPQSVSVTYADKQLFLSSLNSLNIIDDLNYDGIPSHKIGEYLSGLNQNIKTYGLIRGERLLELIDEILDMFSQHGHEIGKDPRGSIIQSTQERVENLKKRIKDELKNGQNNIIINHNLRLD
jgi:hypothetical protein